MTTTRGGWLRNAAAGILGVLAPVMTGGLHAAAVDSPLLREGAEDLGVPFRLV